MPLSVGDRLGPYEILAPIGAGGMGEVYRALDTKLKREVALKVLPDSFASDPERMARFQREAEVLAALNHPNIAAIYGVEERALVMELVPGESLKGPLPLDTALNYAKQIADALEAAHDKGVVHRDLKPANIMITPAGVVKVLDFGLATVSPDLASGSADRPNSPTLTMRATQAGMLMGTAAYMSPEQAAGKPVDRRADIWSFGVVLWEMLTGNRLFDGETISHTLADVLRAPIDFEKLPKETPTAIRNLLRRCLDRDVKTRLRDIGEARVVISRVGKEPEAPATAAPSPSRLGYVAWGVAGMLFFALASLAFVHFRERPSVPQSLRYQIPPPGSAVAQFLKLSPDGRQLAFVTYNGGRNQVWVRAMDTLQARALAGTDGATFPFWSPDGTYLGFFTDGKLKKIAIAGGPPQTLCDVTDGCGGTWNREGVILFASGSATGIFHVPAAGGTPVRVVEHGFGEGDRFPAFLPDGVHFVYSAGSVKPNVSGVWVGSLDGSAAVHLLPDTTNALYAPAAPPGASGHLLFRRDGTLMAQPFDAKGLKTVGDAFPVSEQVADSISNQSYADFSASENGILVYNSGNSAAGRELVWLDRAGKRLGAIGKPAAFRDLAISPDEKTLAAQIGTFSGSDIWLQDMGRGVFSRFTFRSGINKSPVWSPDGSRLIFSSQAASTAFFDIYQKPAAGNGQEELLLRGVVSGYSEDWSPDGKWLVYQQADQKTATDLWLLPLTGDRKPIPYLQTPFDETGGQFSPDGRWMAYQSNESGGFQVYVQTVPPSGAKFQISSLGGTEPQWRRDGKELYFVSGDQKLTAVPINLGATVEAGMPQPLFPVFPMGISGTRVYAPTRDGQRFLVNAPAGGEAAPHAPITVVTNWQAGLKK